MSQGADQLPDAVDAGDPLHPATTDPAQVRAARRAAPVIRPVEGVVDHGRAQARSRATSYAQPGAEA